MPSMDHAWLIFRPLTEKHSDCQINGADYVEIPTNKQKHEKLWKTRTKEMIL